MAAPTRSCCFDDAPIARKRAPADLPPAKRPAEAASKRAPAEPPQADPLCMASYKKAVLVTGNTKPVKERLKQLGGRWNWTLRGWVFPGSARPELARAFPDIVDVL